MAKFGDFNIKDFKKMQEAIEKMNDPKNKEKFMRECVQEIAMEALRRVIKKTPVAKTISIIKTINSADGSRKQVVETIHTGGTLRRGWTAKSEKQAMSGSGNTCIDIKQFVLQLKVEKINNSYVVWLVNPVEYASYVEYGHRQKVGRFVPAIGKRLKASWVEGQFMLKKSMDEVDKVIPKFLEAKMQDYLEQLFGGEK